MCYLMSVCVLLEQWPVRQPAPKHWTTLGLGCAPLNMSKGGVKGELHWLSESTWLHWLSCLTAGSRARGGMTRCTEAPPNCTCSCFFIAGGSVKSLGELFSRSVTCCRFGKLSNAMFDILCAVAVSGGVRSSRAVPSRYLGLGSMGYFTHAPRSHRSGA